MALRTAPIHFIKNMQQTVDPLLDARWSDLMSCWVIDRKAVIPSSEIAFLTKRAARTERWAKESPGDGKKKETANLVAEELISARAGRRVIFLTRNLTPKTFDRLALSDIQRYGGYSRMAEELEKNEQIAEVSAERVRVGELDDVNREVYGMLDFMRRKKDAILHTTDPKELRLNTILHGR